VEPGSLSIFYTNIHRDLVKHKKNNKIISNIADAQADILTRNLTKYQAGLPTAVLVLEFAVCYVG
jgi:hypothetical protein